METDHEKDTSARTHKPLPIEPILNAFRDQGRMWARYGLTVGKLALETHAKAMSSLATTLGAVADAMTAKPAESSEAQRTADPS